MNLVIDEIIHIDTKQYNKETEVSSREKSLNMYAIVIFTLLFGYTLGAQPHSLANATYSPSAEGENYVYYGEEAADGEFPFIVSLQRQTDKKHYCAATILTKKWALTTANCCNTTDEVDLYAGTNSQSENGTVHRVEFKEIHENYDQERKWRNDICVVKVKDPFVFGEKVKKVTLPPQGYPVNNGDLVTIAGWGLTSRTSKVQPDKLQVGRNYVALSPEKCSTLTGHSHESYLCALGGKKNQGACNGDAGSPLLKNGIQVGISSWIYLPCGVFPDFYARVPIFVDWIKKVLGNDAAQLQFAK